MKKILCIILAVSLVAIISGCGKKDQSSESSNGIEPAVVSQTEPDRGNIDPLTGLYGLDDSAVGKRPVAVMINNLSPAQDVQTGLNNAGIIFESMVEGGITRLMAVYSDISSVGQIGTVRSARYTYVQLAKGLDAIYVHCGMDNVYTKPYADRLDDFDYLDLMNAGDSYSFREKNGLSYEHTLYTKGELLEKATQSKFRTDIRESKSGTAFDFNDPEESVSAGEQCDSVKFAMSSDYKTTFKYDSDDKTFIRCPGSETQTDYITGKKTRVKNVILLVAPVYPFDDDYHVRTDLDGGDGYYISQGGYSKITWEKGGASDKLVLKTSDGAPLSINAGNSWVALVPTSQSQSITFGGTAAESIASSEGAAQ